MPDSEFIGRGWGFPPTFRKETCGVDMLTGKDDIQNSIEILFSTGIGERIMQPDYGADMERLLFEPMNITLLTFMADRIEQAILFFEPRINLNNVRLSPVQEEGLIQIFIDYTIKGTNSRDNFVYPFYIIEGTEIS